MKKSVIDCNLCGQSMLLGGSCGRKPEEGEDLTKHRDSMGCGALVSTVLCREDKEQLDRIEGMLEEITGHTRG